MTNPATTTGGLRRRAPKAQSRVREAQSPIREEQRQRIGRWAARPDQFAAEALGVDLWSKQREIALALRDHPRVAVRSCHAAGKTFLAATCIVWFCYTRPGAIALTTASTYRQVRYVLWRTLHRLIGRAPLPLGGVLTDAELRLGDQWYALGLSTDQPDRFQGFHAPHVLVVVDEPGAIPPPVFGAIEGVLASGDTRLLMIGNPTQPHGPFFDAFHDDRAQFRSFRISAFDTPNFTDEQDRPELVSTEWVESRRRMWGETSDLYRSRVLGEFPSAGVNQLFPLSLLDRAVASTEAGQGGTLPPALGVDIARYGADATAFTWIENGSITRQEQFHGASLMETAGRIRAALRETPDLALALDDTGLGGGVTDRLREQGLAPLAINFGASPIDREHDANRASELYHLLRDALQQRHLRIDPDLPTRDTLIAQLAGITYRFTSDGRRAIDNRGAAPSGAASSAAGGAASGSPDLADSLALAWAACEDAARGAGVW